MKKSPVLVGIACFGLSMSTISAAAVSELETKLQARVEAATKTGQPEKFIEFREELQRRTPALTPEEKTFVAHYSDALDTGLAARPVRVLRVKIESYVNRVDGPAEAGSPMDPPSSLKLAPYIAGLRTAMAAAGRDNGVCELQFRPPFGPKEATATWKTLTAYLIFTYQNYSSDNRQNVGVLPREFRVNLRFGDRCVEAPSNWLHPRPDSGAWPGDIILVAEGVPAELEASQLKAYGDKLQEKLLHQLTTRIATFPRLEFFPKVDRTSVSLNSILMAKWHERPTQLTAFLMLEPERFAKELDAFWKNAPRPDIEKIIGSLIQANYKPAAPHIIELLPTLSAQGIHELENGLMTQPEFADDTMLRAMATCPNYHVCMLGWNYLKSRPKVLDLKALVLDRMQNPSDPHWRDYLLFYTDELHGKVQKFAPLLFPPTELKLSEEYAHIFLLRVDRAEVEAFASGNYCQLRPTVAKIFFHHLDVFAPNLIRDFEAAQKLLEKRDARTPEENAQLQQLERKYLTVRKAMQAAANATSAKSAEKN